MLGLIISTLIISQRLPCKFAKSTLFKSARHICYTPHIHDNNNRQAIHLLQSCSASRLWGLRDGGNSNFFPSYSGLSCSMLLVDEYYTFGRKQQTGSIIIVDYTFFTLVNCADFHIP